MGWDEHYSAEHRKFDEELNAFGSAAEISVRAYNCLQNTVGAETYWGRKATCLADFALWTDQDFLRIKNFGKVCLAEIEPLRIALRQARALKWPDATPEMQTDPRYEIVWRCIEQWRIAVPGAYDGITEATGHHVRAILDALDTSYSPGPEALIETTSVPRRL